MSDADHDPLEEAFSASLVAVDVPLLRFRLLLPAGTFLVGLQSRMSMIGEGGLKSCPRTEILSLSLRKLGVHATPSRMKSIIFGASNIITSIATG